jgi:thioredoxin-related protein
MNKSTHLALAALGMAFFNLSSPLGASTPEGWTSDFTSAQARATEQEQAMLLMFTGSDWCGWCKTMHKEILDTPTFMEWASENIVLVYVDFPRKDYRSEAVKLQNENLDEKYNVTGYPTLILINSQGDELTRLSYMQGGPKTFIRAIKRAYQDS